MIRSREVIIKVIVFISILLLVIIALVPTVLLLLSTTTHQLTAVVHALIVFKALVAWLYHILAEVLLHVLLVPPQLVVSHFVKISVLVIKFLKIVHIIFAPTVIF